MKLNKNIFIMALASLTLVGCADLDTEPLGSTITTDQKDATVEANPERVGAGVNAISVMFSVYMNVFPADERHDDFGYPALMLYMDSRGMDLVSEGIGYNWFSGSVYMTGDWNISGVTNVMTWETLYNQIFTANAVAEGISLEEQLNEETADPTYQFYLGQALALRAFDYFHLAQMYQQTYVGHEDKPCVPIITDENKLAVAEAGGTPRNTVREVYEQIMSDLNNAVTLLEASNVKRTDRRYVDAAVVHGIRARVEMVMNDWAAARDDAKAAIELTDARPATIEEVSKPTFKDMTEPNWMWGIKIAEEDRVVTSGIVNWPSHMGSLNYGYASVGAWRYISKKLYNSIPANDVRKGWWLDEDSKSANLNEDQQAYVDGAEMKPYTQMKFAPYKDEIYTSTNANDIPLMRIEEMYLILAEATAMAGDAGEGKSVLETFVQTYRYPAYSAIGSSAEEIQEAVWNQRRIELWGEGLSYFDILRMKKGIDRRGAGFEAAYVYNIEPEDNILIFKIPNVETEANKFINGEMDNNPDPEVPTPVDDEE